MELYIHTQGIAGWAPMNPSWMGSPEPLANVEGAVSAECAHAE